MNVVLDLGANIECNEKNLIDFACMGSALFKSLLKNENPKVALLNVGLEEIKGNETIKKAYQFLKDRSRDDFKFHGYISATDLIKNIENTLTDFRYAGQTESAHYRCLYGCGKLIIFKGFRLLDR